MASLAIMVSLMFMGLLLCGPVLYGLSFVSLIPDALVVIGAVACISYGFYWLALPIWPASLFGLVPTVFGFLALDKRVKKRLGRHDGVSGDGDSGGAGQ